ncbi:MAG: hypothetical protein WBY75_08445 [Terracidiphilus sp.]
MIQRTNSFLRAGAGASREVLSREGDHHRFAVNTGGASTAQRFCFARQDTPHMARHWTNNPTQPLLSQIDNGRENQRQIK